MNYQAQFGEKHEVSLKYKNRFSDFLIMFDLVGESYNSLESASNENDILNVLNLIPAPKYSYYSGINKVLFNVKFNSGEKDFFEILVAILLGILFGYLGRMMPNSIMESCHLIVQSILASIF